jgi:hypothetical protein
MSGVDLKRLGIWERKILRRVHGPVVEQGMWKIKTNQKLRELYENLDIVTDNRKEEIGMCWTCYKKGTRKDN